MAIGFAPRLSTNWIGRYSPRFPYDRREKADFYLTFFKAFMTRCQGIRRNGSAALDLCYVACGGLTVLAN